ncbi:MAG: PEP-CTERM sorting domain-containing protein [Crocosphaera sp.]|nr:PEP-CTERM sorting domain-containing protein [Crocosphaera sp.]
MKQLFKLHYTLLVASLAIPFAADTAQAQFTVDPFTADQDVEDTMDNDMEVTGTIDNDGSFLGGLGATRQFILNIDEKDAGAAPNNGVALVSGTGELNFNGDTGVLGTGMVVYSGGAFDSGLDITDEGALDAFRLEIQSSNVPFDLIFDLTDTDDNNAVFTERIQPPVFSGPEDFSVALSNFAGVDLTSLSQLKLTYDLSFNVGTDVRLNIIETFDDPNIPNPEPGPGPMPPTSVPEPGSMLGLFALTAFGATTAFAKRVK